MYYYFHDLFNDKYWFIEPSSNVESCIIDGNPIIVSCLKCNNAPEKMIYINNNFLEKEVLEKTIDFLKRINVKVTSFSFSPLQTSEALKCNIRIND